MEKKTDFKSLSTKSKVEYIWDYYRWPILVTIAVAAFAFSLFRHYATYKEPLLNVIMINSNDGFSTNESGFDEFLTSYGYDPSSQPISLSANLRFSEGEYAASYNDVQVLTMMVAAGGQDLFFGSGRMFMNYADQGALMDLSKVLPAELLERYSDKLIYSTAEGTVESYPCAVELTDNEWLTKNNYYNTCYFGIFYSSPQPEVSAQFAEFLLDYRNR